MRRRSDAEQIEDHQLAVVIPTSRQKSRLRLPPVRQDERIAGEHPLEVHAPVDGVGKANNVGIVGKQRRPSARRPTSSAVSIDESSLCHSRAPVRRLTKWKNQPCSCGIRSAKKRSVVARAIHDAIAREPAALGCDAHSREPEADRRNAADFRAPVRSTAGHRFETDRG